MIEPDVLERVSQDVDTVKQKKWSLTLWNDDINTFEWVIQSLIELCNHEPEQAEQCANFVHYKGKCVVKSGSKDDMISLKEAFLLRKITATVDC